MLCCSTVCIVACSEVPVPPSCASPRIADTQESNPCICWLLGVGFLSPFASAQSLELAASEVLVSTAQTDVNASSTLFSLKTYVGPWYQRVLLLGVVQTGRFQACFRLW